MRRKRRYFLKTILRYSIIFLTISFFFTSVQVITFSLVNPPFTPLMVYRLVKKEGMNHTWRSLSKISPFLQQAVLASEDQLFLAHNGFDFNQIDQALQEHTKKKRWRGASTISMQVARNLFLWQGYSWARKILEAYYTILIEQLWSKERILEMYLNSAEWGRGIFGAEAAARHYFNCSADSLSRDQAALMAAVLPNPRRWSPARPTSYILRRKAFILEQMYKFRPLRK